MKRTTADDTERVLRLLTEAPSPGLTMAALAAATHWPLWTVNEVLCDLGAQITHFRTRVGQSMVTHYELKSKRQP